MSMYVILSILLIAVGSIMLIRPTSFFEWTESWKSDTKSEPSKRYLFGTRFGGVMCVLAGAGGLIVLALSR